MKYVLGERLEGDGGKVIMEKRYKYAPGGYRFVGFVFGQGQVWHVTRSRRGSSILYCCFTWKAYTDAAQTRPLYIRHVSRFPTVETRSLAFEKYRMYTFQCLEKCREKILRILLELIIQVCVLSDEKNKWRERWIKIEKIVNKFRSSMYEKEEEIDAWKMMIEFDCTFGRLEIRPIFRTIIDDSRLR